MQKLKRRWKKPRNWHLSMTRRGKMLIPFCFFDEANTTDAIDLIKEIMVDRRVSGRTINPELTRLHFIAACNPYRK